MIQDESLVPGLLPIRSQGAPRVLLVYMIPEAGGASHEETESQRLRPVPSRFTACVASASCTSVAVCGAAMRWLLDCLRL